MPGPSSRGFGRRPTLRRPDWSGSRSSATGRSGRGPPGSADPTGTPPAESGFPLLSSEELTEVARDAEALHAGLAVHAIGDRAIAETLAVFARVRPTVRPRIEHVSLAPPNVLARLDAVRPHLVVQPRFVPSDAWVVERLGPRPGPLDLPVPHVPRPRARPGRVERLARRTARPVDRDRRGGRPAAGRRPGVGRPRGGGPDVHDPRRPGRRVAGAGEPRGRRGGGHRRMRRDEPPHARRRGGEPGPTSLAGWGAGPPQDSAPANDKSPATSRPTMGEPGDVPTFKVFSPTMRVDVLVSDWRNELDPALPRRRRRRRSTDAPGRRTRRGTTASDCGSGTSPTGSRTRSTGRSGKSPGSSGRAGTSGSPTGAPLPSGSRSRRCTGRARAT